MDALREEILARCPPEVLASRNAEAIAAAVSVGRVRLIERLGGVREVLDTLGPTAGAQLLDSLYEQRDSMPEVRWGWTLIDRGELNFGSPETREMIDQLVPAEHRAALKALAEVPDPVSEFTVRCALWDVDGNWLGG